MAKFKVIGTINITNCAWTLTACNSDGYRFFYIDGGILICSNMSIISCSVLEQSLIECNNGGILNCIGLQILGFITSTGSLIKLHSGTSALKDSVCFFLTSIFI
jgi:hypothetical protein